MQYINTWFKGSGNVIETKNPATGILSWSGFSASDKEVQLAIEAAQEAYKTWGKTELTTRIALLQVYAGLLKEKLSILATCIAEETGKPLWESKTEVSAMIAKIDLSISAYQERTGLKEKPIPGGMIITRHKPLGVMAVLGPYNFPGHLPNGHIVPALLAGNTVVFKPSEFTPQTSILMCQIWEEAGLPPGVLNLVLGGAQIGQILIKDPNIKAILFTGSYATGKLIHEYNAGHPEKLLALEMGGNNPLIVWKTEDIEAAAYHIVQSAYLSAGQRCTCARRLIIQDNQEGKKLLEVLIRWIKQIKIGYWRDQPEPFMGPVISARTAEKLLNKQQQLLAQGGEILIPMEHKLVNTGLLTPGLIDVTSIPQLEDSEIFGPLLQVIRVKDFETALNTANATQYGLIAGLYTDHENLYREFYAKILAGVISWNRPLTGASSAAPFGGIGHSGNHRPSAYYAADYCVYPVASSESTRLLMPENLTPGLTHE